MNRLVLPCIFLLLLVAVGCLDGKDDIRREHYLGSWEWSEGIEGTAIYRVSGYTFRPDGTYEFYLVGREKPDSQNLGFQQVGQGNYVVKGADLTFSNMRTFVNANPDRLFVGRDALTEVSEGEGSQMVRVAIQQNKTKLIMEFPCQGDVCPETEVFTKID